MLEFIFYIIFQNVIPLADGKYGAHCTVEASGTGQATATLGLSYHMKQDVASSIACPSTGKFTLEVSHEVTSDYTEEVKVCVTR